ncbi:hypothetical protein ABH15_11595 [Methanoculleus taiwanensis]|uniref:DUF424 domain-containing protein n=1 Tax=Methanoculleus taiwanensis TaxID=1550565 RepID=A0A498GZ65_9EURY|nr:DUF424 domain-containing protein [Methanoculleus taiwanensis]RXE55385.1 hypothetical protein ABH15_11595 [Methanoculleus taiwanensis]
MYLKVHHISGSGDVVAVCDRELLDTTLCHGDVEVCVTRGFYGSETATEEEVRRALKGAANVNLMGKRVVAIAIDMGLITRENCIMIGDIPHAQLFRI